ncbi:response regulator [Vibrio sp. RE86]|uniref:response regulator n=1 Tax=Vibrio sp. RE86 TaxID=2607605 RepID=UPI001493D9B3|nr:hybrid sensor histidine kinase/response regulator [Vibrio sp. RE86]NOH81598.1 response regulator [Vibrio sp. RE86]
MLDSMDGLQLHPVFLMLTFVSFIVLQWSVYFYKSTKQITSTRLQNIKIPYLCYSLSIMGWILSNAYFYSPLLVYLGEDAGIAAALAANLLSYSAFACAYLVCLYLARPNTIKIEITMLAIASLLVVTANLFNYDIIKSISIDEAGQFALHFGESTSYFFLIVLGIICLSFRCVILYARNAKPLQQIKSIYMLLGISVFMTSTLLVHVVVPIFYNDFSLAWLPPALSISEMFLMGYALVTSRFYSSRHILYRIISLSISMIVVSLPVLFFIEATNTKSTLSIILLTAAFTGICWKWLNEMSKQLASEVVFNHSFSPQRRIYNLADSFQTSIDKPLGQIASILGVSCDSIQLVSNIQDEPIYTRYLKSPTNVLVLEEIEDTIPYTQNPKEVLSLRKLYQKMDTNNIAMVLPIFDQTNNVAHLLIARKKHNGRLFFGEEIQALQSVLKKAQGYINADLKIKQSQALANSIAHEMRNPLAQAQLEFENIYQLISSTTSSDTLREHALKGKRAIDRGKQLIDIILREVNHSSLALEPTEPTDISSSIRSTIELYGFEHNADRARISLDLEQNFIAKINDTLFNFVMFNLLRNATYYFDSYPNSRIEIRTEQGKFENYVLFRDTGPGIPESLQSRIFDDFFSHKKSGGSGLGLGYCQRVMTSFGGSISCTSVLGQFTEFKLSFPATNLVVNSGVSPEEGKGTQQPPTDSQEPLLAKPLSFDFSASKMILVVDDKEVQRTLVKLYLEQLGYGVVLANNGKVAIEIIQSNPIDLVFMDIQMPVMDGFEAASIIRQSYPAIPIIALSGESGEKEIERMSELMNGRLSKPTTKEALSKILNSALKEPSLH